MEIKNLEKTALRILKAIKGNEKIILYGDSDIDGVSSVIILQMIIEKLGGKILSVYFPDRGKEGYGINRSALKYLKKNAPALFIALDCGIGNFEEIKEAEEMGFEVIVIDHHIVLEKLPQASIIVDPKQEGDNYPFKNFACAGVAYKLAELLLVKENKWDHPEKFLELAALATLADQMPLNGENKKIVNQGLLALSYTQNTGLLAFKELTDFQSNDIQDLFQKVIAPLNSAENKKHSNEIYVFLTETSLQKAKRMAKSLIKKAEIKKEEVKKICLQIEQRVDSLPESIVFEGDTSWPLILLGAAASKICRKYHRPVFIFERQKDKNQGAVRCPSEVDGVKAMASCKLLLKTYGGHPQAAGFMVESDKIEKFKSCLLKYFED